MAVDAQSLTAMKTLFLGIVKLLLSLPVADVTCVAVLVNAVLVNGTLGRCSCCCEVGVEEEVSEPAEESLRAADRANVVMVKLHFGSRVKLCFRQIVSLPPTN